MNIEDRINISAPRVQVGILILSTEGDRRIGHGYIVVLHRTLKQ